MKWFTFCFWTVNTLQNRLMFLKNSKTKSFSPNVKVLLGLWGHFPDISEFLSHILKFHRTGPLCLQLFSGVWHITKYFVYTIDYVICLWILQAIGCLNVLYCRQKKDKCSLNSLLLSNMTSCGCGDLPNQHLLTICEILASYTSLFTLLLAKLLNQRQSLT